MFIIRFSNECTDNIIYNALCKCVLKYMVLRETAECSALFENRNDATLSIENLVIAATIFLANKKMSSPVEQCS